MIKKKEYIITIFVFQILCWVLTLLMYVADLKILTLFFGLSAVLMYALFELSKSKWSDPFFKRLEEIDNDDDE